MNDGISVLEAENHGREYVMIATEGSRTTGTTEEKRGERITQRPAALNVGFVYISFLLKNKMSRRRQRNQYHGW
jgi:hypothetical protein